MHEMSLAEGVLQIIEDHAAKAGFARVSQKFGNGHRTLNYLGAGQIYGLQEIAHCIPICFVVEGFKKSLPVGCL